MDSSVGLAIQCVGILLITLLSFFMRGSIRSASLKYWTTAWSCLSLSLLSLFVGFRAGAPQTLFYALYFFGEYAFGLMFVAGCLHHAAGARISRSFLYLLIPALLLAASLPHLSADFNDLFIVQATVMASLFAASLLALRPVRQRKESSPGLRVMSVALLLLTIDFLHYVPIFAARKGLWGITVPGGYLKYTSIFDLILEILLGFGTMMVLMEGVRREVEAVNRDLTDARDKLEAIARIDPLTEALNRHAFYALMNRNESGTELNVSGCVVIIDIDSLKPINDRLGHSAGDRAIRAVAHAVRSLVRADDMLFRWGGDEFLVLMFNIPAAEVGRRLARLNGMLDESGTEWSGAPLRITVSYGVSGFTSLTGIKQAIEQADEAMYSSRRQIREAQKEVQVG